MQQPNLADFIIVTDRALIAQAEAARRFAETILGPLPVAWMALDEDHPLLMPGGIPIGGEVRLDESDRPCTVTFCAALDTDDATRAALVVLHEAAHLLQAEVRGGALPTDDDEGHGDEAWHGAVRILTRSVLRADLADHDDRLMWPQGLRHRIAGAHPIFHRLVADLAAAALNPRLETAA